MNLVFVDNYDFPPRFQESQKTFLKKFCRRENHKSKISKVQHFREHRAGFISIRDGTTYFTGLQISIVLWSLDIWFFGLKFSAFTVNWYFILVSMMKTETERASSNTSRSSSPEIIPGDRPQQGLNGQDSCYRRYRTAFTR